MSDIRFCSEHEFFEGSSCSECSRTGVQIISNNKRGQVSTFLSGLLRHFADDFDLHISSNGWADYDTVLDITQEKYGLQESQLLAIVAMDGKGRYELDNGSIRAVYAHSIDGVEVESSESADTPSKLYHGTAPRFRDSIMSEGIQPKGRNQVHLSKEKQDAIDVGERHTNSDTVILLTVDAHRLEVDGYEVKTTNGNVYTVDEVEPEYITDTEAIN